MINALILAGGLNNGPLSRCCSEAYEALIPLDGKQMVRYVAEALARSRAVNRVLVVGPGELISLLPGISVLPTGNSVMDNLQLGCQALPDSDRVLVATADIPLLTTEVVDRFIGLCGDCARDFYFPVVRKEIVEARYPGVTRTYVKLREGTFTGGNLFLVNPAAVPAGMSVGQELVALRKSPFKLSRKVGLLFLLKFLFKHLSLDEAEQKVSGLLTIKGRAVICNDPEVGVDVDKPGDLEIVRQAMGISETVERTG